MKIIKWGAFAANGDLETIILNHTHNLQVVEEGAFRELPNLNKVYFHASSIRTLHERAAYWMDVDTIDVTGTELDCSCELMWLKEFSMKKNHSARIRCSSPKSVSGRDLQSLTDEELQCASDITRHQAIIWILSGLSVLIIAPVVIALYLYRQRIKCRQKLGRPNGCVQHSTYHSAIPDDEFILYTNIQGCKSIPMNNTMKR